MWSTLTRDFPPTRRFLVGVSGGRDSVVLLHQLAAHGYRRLIVCHLDHGLRGRMSRGDLRFVAELARHYGFDAEIQAADVRGLAKTSRLSLETAARAARFAFFVSIARRRRCRTIFLAHHADDLVETALLNLFRGAGPAGIASMKGVARHRIGKTELTIVRPLLKNWRSEIDTYAEKHQIDFREDATNALLDSTRNRIRHQILPAIKKDFGRDVRPAIWRAAQIWEEESAFLDSLLRPEMFSGAQLAVGELRKLPLALQRRTIWHWLRHHGIGGVNFEVIENVRALLDLEAGVAKVNLVGARHARRKEGRIFLV